MKLRSLVTLTLGRGRTSLGSGLLGDVLMNHRGHSDRVRLGHQHDRSSCFVATIAPIVARRSVLIGTQVDGRARRLDRRYLDAGHLSFFLRLSHVVFVLWGSFDPHELIVAVFHLNVQKRVHLLTLGQLRRNSLLFLVACGYGSHLLRQKLGSIAYRILEEVKQIWSLS